MVVDEVDVVMLLSDSASSVSGLISLLSVMYACMSASSLYAGRQDETLVPSDCSMRATRGHSEYVALVLNVVCCIMNYHNEICNKMLFVVHNV